MAFVAYPSTPDFAKFRKNFILVNSVSATTSGETNLALEPRKRTFVGAVKLHGTNASIIIRNSSNPVVQYQSRNKVISTDPKDDNIGTAAFLSNVPLDTLLAEILRIRGASEFEEIFIVGEWAGTGIQKGVAIASLKRFFAIFNIRVDGHWVDIRDYKTVHSPVDRVYNIANFMTFEVTIDIDNDEDWGTVFKQMKQYTLEVAGRCPVGETLLQEVDATAVSKNGGAPVAAGEGIVWTMVPTSGNDYQLYNFKMKAEQFSVTAYAPKSRATGSVNHDAVTEFVDFALGKCLILVGTTVFTISIFVGERRLEQGIEYLQEIGKDPDEMKSVEAYMRWVIEDVIKEEGWRLEERDESGLTPLQRGVTEKQVKKLVGSRARDWFIERRNREVA